MNETAGGWRSAPLYSQISPGQTSRGQTSGRRTLGRLGLALIVVTAIVTVLPARALARSGEGDLRQSAPVETMSDAFADLGSFEPHAVGSSELTAEETAHEVVARLRAGGLDLGRELG